MLTFAYILVSFGEVRTHSSTWSYGTRESTDARINNSGDSNSLSHFDITVSSGQKESRNLVRSKRDAGDQQNYTIELLVVVDGSMVEYHGKDKVEQYVLTLMSSASRLFLDKSIGSPIDLAVVKILIREDLKAESLCNWIEFWNWSSNVINYVKVTLLYFLSFVAILSKTCTINLMQLCCSHG